jgi:RNA polymerase sigma-70 factor (ECF subfamily)
MQRLLVSGEAAPAEEMQSAEDRQGTRRSIEELPDRLKQVLIMVALQGLTYREAAEALEIPIGSVKSRVHAAIRRLSKAMDGTLDATLNRTWRFVSVVP